jgi:predicted ATPase
LAEADAGRNPVSVGFALTWCTLIGSLGQNIEAAEGWIARLKDHSEKHALKSYHGCCLGFEGLLAAERGDISSAERLLRACLEELRQCRYEVLYYRFLSGLAEVFATAGWLDDSLVAVDEVLRNAERDDAFWWMPEALRIKGEVLLLSNKADVTLAEDCFHRSLDLARRQGALSWELKTALSLGRLYFGEGRARDAGDLVRSVYDRFAEGFETADLQYARELLEQWTSAENLPRATA